MAAQEREVRSPAPRKMFENRPWPEVLIALFIALLVLKLEYDLLYWLFGRGLATLGMVVTGWFARGAYDSPHWHERWGAVLRFLAPFGDWIRAQVVSIRKKLTNS